MNKMLLRMKKDVFTLGSINLVAMEKNKTVATLCVPDVRETFFFYFFADNFTGSKDTEPYKMDVSFLWQYRISGTTFTTAGLGLQLQNFLSILEK